MKLLTKDLLNQFEKQGINENLKNSDKVICKFFNPCGSQTWYAIKFNPKTRIFYGFADMGFPEFGTFSLDELESVIIKPFGLGIERDLYFTQITVEQLKPQYNM